MGDSKKINNKPFFSKYNYAAKSILASYRLPKKIINKENVFDGKFGYVWKRKVITQKVNSY